MFKQIWLNYFIIISFTSSCKAGILLLEKPLRATICENAAFQLSCNYSQRIAIESVQYGAKSGNCTNEQCCIFDDADCLISYNDTELREVCSGRSLCNMYQISAVEMSSCGIGYPILNHYSSMEFYCLPESRISRMCTFESKTVSGNILYMLNQDYPSTIRPLARNCSCSVETQSCDSQIRVYFLHFMLGGGSGTCNPNQKIIITDSGRTEIYNCSNDNSYVISVKMTSKSNYITVVLDNPMGIGSGSFWLGFEATNSSDNLTMECPSKPQTPCIVQPQPPDIRNREIVGVKTVVRGTEDQPLTLTCISRGGYPEPQVNWTSGSSFLPATSRVSNISADGYFIVIVEYTFIALRNYDMVNYSCQSSFDGSDEQPLVSSVLLYLDLKPSYPLIYSNDTVTEGQNSTFQCTSSGCRPQGGITWKYDGIVISRPVNFSFDSGAETYTMTSTYTTGELSRTDNGKRVECIVSHKTLTDLSNRSQSRDVNVKYPPDVFVNTTNGTVNDLETVLICEASGFPSIYTYSEWTQTWPGRGSILRSHSGAREWILNPLTYEDTGIYQCGASNNVARWNTLETVMKGTVFLLIKSVPVVTKPILQSKDDIHKIRGILGKTFTVVLEIYSNFDGADDVVISFQENNTRSVGNSFIQKKMGDVELPIHGQIVPTSGIHINVTHRLASEDEFGEFHIKIQNSIGITDYQFEVVAEGRPCSPIDPLVETSEQKKVVISWIRCFHGGFAQSFMVQYSTDKVIWINATTVDGGLSTSKERLNVTLTNLQVDTAYFIRIFSYNLYGSSNYSEYLDVTIKSEAFAQPQPETVNSGALAAGWAVAGVLALALIVSLFLSYRKGRLPGCRKSNLKKETTFSSNASENNRSTPGNRENLGDYDNLRRGSSPYENAAQQPTATGTDEQTSVSVYDDLRPEKKAEHLYSSMQAASGRAKAPHVIYSNLKMSAPE